MQLDIAIALLGSTSSFTLTWCSEISPFSYRWFLADVLLLPLDSLTFVHEYSVNDPFLPFYWTFSLLEIPEAPLVSSMYWIFLFFVRWSWIFCWISNKVRLIRRDHLRAYRQCHCYRALKRALLTMCDTWTFRSLQSTANRSVRSNSKFSVHFSHFRAYRTLWSVDISANESDSTKTLRVHDHRNLKHKKMTFACSLPDALNYKLLWRLPPPVRDIGILVVLA